MKISSFFLPFFHFKIDVRVKHLDVRNTKYVTFCLPPQLILGSISFIIRDSSPRMLHRSLYYIAAQCLYESCQFSFDQYPDLRYYGCLNTTLPLVLNAYYAMDPINNGSNYFQSSMFEMFKLKIGCSSLITNL